MCVLHRMLPTKLDMPSCCNAPGFWNDNEKAQGLLRKRSQAEAKLDLARRLGQQIEDALDFLELGASENDDQVIADAAAQAV